MKKMLFLALASLGACVAPPYEYEPLGPAHPPLHAREITRLAAAGISTEVIQELIDARGVRPLDADDLVSIKKAGYDDDMIRKMIAAERPDVPAVQILDFGYPSLYGGYSSYSYSYSSWGFRGSGAFHR